MHQSRPRKKYVPKPRAKEIKPTLSREGFLKIFVQQINGYAEQIRNGEVIGHHPSLDGIDLCTGTVWGNQASHRYFAVWDFPGETDAERWRDFLDHEFKERVAAKYMSVKSEEGEEMGFYRVRIGYPEAKRIAHLLGGSREIGPGLGR